VNVIFESAYSGHTGEVLQIDDPDGGPPVRVELTEEVNVSAYRAQVIEAPASEDEDTENSVPESLRVVETDDWWVCTSFVSTNHLAQDTPVIVLADGAVVEGLTVNAGGVS